MRPTPEESPDDLISAAAAAEIISKNSCHEVKPQYMNQLVRQKKIIPHKLDDRTNVFRRGDAAGIIVEKRGGKHKQDHSKRRPRKKKGELAEQKNQGE
jgi:hypothetical protein